MLGVMWYSTLLAPFYHAGQGAVVLEVLPGSPFDGHLQAGDIITSVGACSVYDRASLVGCITHMSSVPDTHGFCCTTMAMLHAGIIDRAVDSKRLRYDSHTQLPHDRARWPRMLLASIRRTAALLRACRQLGRRYAHCQCTWPVYCRPHACGSLSHTHNRTSKCAWQPRNSLTMACVIRVPCASLRSEVPSQSINHSSLTMCRGTAALTRENRVEMECVLPLYTRQGEILVRIGTAKSDSVVLFSGHPTLIYSYRTRSFIPTDQPTNHLSRSEWSSYCIVHAQCSSPT